MKKLKILLLALAATISLGAWAETDVPMPSDWQTWSGNVAKFQDGSERYQNANYTADQKVLYQSITAPETGIYEIKFYAVTSSTSDRGFENIYGDNIAVAYASTSNENTVTLPMTVINQTGCTLAESGNIRTLSIEANENDVIEYGLKNIAVGGNWYTIQGISIKMKTVAEIYQPVYDEALNIYNNSDESVKDAKAEFLPYINAMETALNGTLAEAKAAAENLVVAQAIYMSKSAPTRGSGVKYDFTSKMNMAINAWTCAQGNGPAQYGFTGATETYNPGGSYVAGKVMYQTITGLANGEYEVQFYGVANSANSVSEAQGSGYAQAYANSTSQDIELKLQNSCTPSEYSRTITCTVTDGTLEFGLKNIAEGGNWYVCKAVALYMTGGPNLDDYYSAIAENLETAKSIQSSGLKMQTEVKTALDDAITNAASYETETVISVLETMNQNLSNAIANAKASIAIYEQIAEINAKATTLDEAGQEAYSETLKKYNDGELSTVEEAQTAYIAAVKAQTTEGSDMTGAINNWDFLNCTNGNFPGWTIYAPNGGNTWKNNDTMVEYWIGSAKNGIFKYYQEITGLPAGKYKLSASMFNDTNGEDGASFGDGATGVYGKSGVNTVWGIVNKNQNSLDVYETPELTITNGTLELGVGNKDIMTARWFVVDYIKLTLISSIQLNDYYDLIQGLITTAEAIGLHNASIKDVLDSKINAATTAIAEPKETDIDELNTIIDELTEAIKNSNESAAIYVKIASINAKAESLDEAGQEAYSETLEKYNNGELSTVEEAQKAYIAAVKAQTTIGSDWSGLIVNSSFEETTDVWNNGWKTDRNTTGNFDYKLLEESASGITDGKYVLNAWASQINFIRVSQSINLPVGVYELSAAVYSDLVKDQHIEAIVNDNHYKSAIVNNNKWEILSTQFIVSEEGDVTIGIYSNGNNNDGDHFGWFRVDNFKLKYCGPVKSANMTITDANWGTFCAPFDVAVPEGVKAYTAAADGNSVAFTEVTTTIPAGTPVVVYSATVVNKEFNGKATATGETCTEGALVGFYAATSDIEAATGYTNYVLQSNTQGVGFYKVAEGSKISLNANRCYMTLATLAGAKDCVVLDGIVTGINNILNPTDKSAEGIYDLNGRKLAAPQKGINIINGVKVIVK